MHRRKFLESGIFSVIALAAAKNGLTLSKNNSEWKITMLNNDIGIFTEMGGTIMFHVAKDGFTVVDAQFPSSALHLIAELQKKNLPFNLLINTHHHRDHTAGNISFKGLTSRVLAHENSLKNQKAVAEKNNIADQQYYPNQTFGKVWSEKAGKETVSLHYYGAAHTDGDAVIHFEKSNIAHVGDLVFNRRHPYIDRSAGANIKSWIQVLNTIEKKYNNQTLFVCGHSGEGYEVKGDKKMIGAFRKYLENAIAFVGAEIKSGKTKAEILKTTSIPGSPEWKGDGIERTLTAAFEELSESHSG